MALVNRISRLFKADFHAVLDRIEEPEQLLRQAIREMEDELQASEQALRLCAHEQQVLQSQKGRLHEKLVEFDQELDLCITSKKDELARAIIRKKLETQRSLKRLNAEEHANGKFLAEQGAQLEENRTALESLKQKAAIFARRSPHDGRSTYGEAQWMAQDLIVSDSEIEVAFLRELDARRAS